MATKKQKRLAAQEKHQKFMEEHRQSGLRAQAKDRERRQKEYQRVLAKAHKNGKHRNAVEGCSLCEGGEG